MKKNLKLIITIIGVIFLVGIGITVAYYSVNVNGNPTTNNIEIGAGTVSLEFSDGSSTINVQNVLPGWSSTKTFTVTNTSAASDAELAYNVILVVTANGFNSGSITYTLAGTGTKAANEIETPIDNGNNQNITMGSATITGAGTIHTYTLTIKYKNLTTDQSSEMGSTLTGYVTLEATSGVAKKQLLSNSIISTADTTDGLYNYGTAGYRYSGATPNNYITFNNETWRIIGFIDGGQIGKTPGTYYTKIIRNASIGSKQWNSNGLNTWYTSSLYNTLNVASDYAYKDKPNVETVNWYHKGRDIADVQAAAMYTAEGWGSDTCTTNSKDCTIGAKVGIMSPSDYGYASRDCYNSKELNAYRDATCTGSNWLYINNTYQWLLEPQASPSDRAWRVHIGGDVDWDNYYPTASYAVRPVVYLKSTVVATGGNGTNSSPYTIG